MATKNTQEWRLTDEEANEIIEQYTMQSSLAAEEVLSPEEIAKMSEEKLQEEIEYQLWTKHDLHE